MKVATTEYFIKMEFPWRLRTNLPTQGSGMLMDKAHPSRCHRQSANYWCGNQWRTENWHSPLLDLPKSIAGPALPGGRRLRSRLSLTGLAVASCVILLAQN